MRTVLAALFSALLIVAVGIQVARWKAMTSSTAWSSGPTVDHLESLSELVCIRVHLSDVLSGENDCYRGAWLIKGDALLAIDLRQAKVLESDPVIRRARVRLPLPRVAAPRVDHERTRTWSVDKTTWVPWWGHPDLLRDDAMRQAQRIIQLSAGSEEHVHAAQKSAERIIREIYRMVGWNVTVEWAPQRK